MNPQYPPFGSVSEGTLKPEDLIPAFADVLEEYAPDEAARIVEEYAAVYDRLDDDDPALEGDEERPDLRDEADYLFSALYDALNNIAPPFAYFGAHWGDGADYGFWPSQYALDWAISAGEVATIGSDDTYCVNIQGRAESLPVYAVEVNDHGNMTLYQLEITRRELWSIV